LGILVFLLVPFVGFYIPEISQIILALLAGVVYMYALFWLFKTLRLFETSRVIPAIGGIIPLFTFGLIYILSSGKEILSFPEIIAFILLIFGSILITLERKKLISFRSFQFSILTAFLFSLAFVLTKYVYLAQSFWNAFIWMRIGGFLLVLAFFIFAPEIKKEIFRKREYFPKKTVLIFFSNQAAGAVAYILQNWAIFLVPLIYVPIINALAGIQYVFIFTFAILFSLKFPKIIKEEISKEIIIQKIIAILLIGTGLVLLVL
jgi:drug/metabolite transporter (DMT)-like permease